MTVVHGTDKVCEIRRVYMSRPVQTIHPTDLGLIPTWISIVGAPAQGFSASWDARKTCAGKG